MIAMKKVTLTETDRMILDSYREPIMSLASYLGDAYEIVLHSLEDPDHSVIQIANGFHTGRQIGAPITDLATYWLEKIETEEEEVNHFSYFSKNKLGEPLKSSTIAIRGSGRQIIGLICINLYLGTPAIHMIADLIPREYSIFEKENFATDPGSVEREVQSAKEQVERDPSVSAQLQKKEIIRILHHRKVFELKNAVEQVANALGVSINTVYFHLRKIAKEE